MFPGARRFSALLAVVLLSGVLVTSTAQPAGAVVKSPAGGVQFHAMWTDYTDAERIAVLDRMQAAGIKWVRIDFGWSSLQPTGPDSWAPWYLKRADLVVDAARARGINVLMMFWRTPGWANGGLGEIHPPTDFADFGVAAQYVANHFKGRVSAWEIWNEPNLKGGGFWKGTIPDYVSLLKASYPRFKAGDPAAKVVAGSVVYNDDTWLRSMYEAGAKGYFDVISTHPYQGVSNEAPEAPDNGTKWRLSHVPAVHNLMKSYGDGKKEIWFTEFGWSDHENTGQEANWQWGVTPAQQADYAVRAFKYVGANFPYVTNMFWYTDRNRTTGKLQLDNYGLLKRDLSPKPVYDALKLFFTADQTPSLEPSPTSSPSPSPTSSPSPAEADPTPSELEPEPTLDPGSTPTEPGEDPSSTTGDDTETGKRENLLRNGSFETGTKGWKTRKVSLYTVKRSRVGRRSGKIRVRNRSPLVMSESVRLTNASVNLELTGFVRPRARGQRVAILLSEIVDGKVVKQGRRRVRTRGLRWQRTPSVRLATSGVENARVKVRIRPLRMRARGLLVDGLKLVER